MLVRSRTPRAFVNACATRKSILVRDFSYAPGLANCLRITVGTPEENDEVLAALAALLKDEIDSCHE